jgi:hypothetical protein
MSQEDDMKTHERETHWLLLFHHFASDLTGTIDLLRQTEQTIGHPG